ncbi:hypothetical protein KDW_41170 [Dictyobacter vulcani]|uniref:Uncharacterized protein n=1 Tax=Dictyobacter vulcani TaxID=2607529 RepID=A0A5J4KQ30_9CHLR|nr:hypothetical protein KDW_41170 [Dictyobacter vulcani]
MQATQETCNQKSHTGIAQGLHKLRLRRNILIRASQACKREACREQGTKGAHRKDQ